MKKIMIVMLVGVLGYFYVFFSRCGILPKDASYKIMLGNRLYQLTQHGLTELGRVQNPDWRMMNTSYRLFLDKQRNDFYFHCAEYEDKKMKYKIGGIYKIKLDNFITKPTLMLVTDFSSYLLSLSPDSNFLFFRRYSTIFSLDLKTGQPRVVVDDYHGSSDIIWLNDHQFIYSSTELRKFNQGYDPVLAINRELNYKMEKASELIEALIDRHIIRNIIFLYDMKTGIKTDFHLDGYYLGTLSPDGERLLLADKDKTILYNIYDGSSEVIANRKTWIERAIWLPDGKGFLYSDAQVGELFEILCDGHYGLYYYSLEKKRSVRLSQYYNLTLEGGFVVPDNIEIKLPDTEINRRIWSGELDNHHLVKIGKIDLIKGIQNVFQAIKYLLGW